MTEKVTITVGEVVTIANAIAALSRPEIGGTIKLNLHGALALSWNLAEFRRVAEPFQTELNKRRDAIREKSGDTLEGNALFEREAGDILKQPFEVSIIRIKSEDFIGGDGGGVLVSVLAPLMGTIIDYSGNGAA